MSVVIDSSVTLAWFFEDERTARCDALMRHVATEGAVVPSLWRLEIANALQMAVRRNRIGASYRDQSLISLRAFPIVVDGETDLHAWERTLGLAERCRLTLYDAAYVELAQRLQLPLATLDREVRAACRMAKVILQPT